jgi:hypothetical protein
MKIEFKRTGGFSPITDASGEISFQGQGGEVTSPDGYRRSLTKDELTELEGLSDDQNLRGPHTAPPPAVRDGFTYEVTVTTDDGKKHTFSSSELERAPAGLSHMLSWVQKESQKILAHKVQNR